MAYVRKSVRNKMKKLENNSTHADEPDTHTTLSPTGSLRQNRKYKYVAYDTGEGPKAIVFSTDEVHYDMANQRCDGKKNVISAGFCHRISDEIFCYGESTSIGVKSRPEQDCELVKTFWEAQA